MKINTLACKKTQNCGEKRFPLLCPSNLNNYKQKQNSLVKYNNNKNIYSIKIWQCTDSDKEVWSCSAFFHISPFQQSKPEGNVRQETQSSIYSKYTDLHHTKICIRHKE